MAEAAVVGIADELTGQAVNAFVALKEGNETTDQIRKDLTMQVRKSIGPFAAPKAVFVVEDLPKTRSGKIMRRILRKILSGEEDSLGDTSTVSTEPLTIPGQTILTISSCRTLALWTRLLRLFTPPASKRHTIDDNDMGAKFLMNYEGLDGRDSFSVQQAIFLFSLLLHFPLFVQF